MRKLGKLILLGLVFVISTSLHTVQASDELDLTGKATDETKTSKINLASSQSSGKAQLSVKATIKSGQAAWTLRDPNGKVRLTGNIKRGDLNINSGELDAIKGNWTLEMAFEGATLTYEVHWRTR